MTKFDIIRMAREAGFTVCRDEWVFVENLERFAAIVAAAKAEACAKIGFEYAEKFANLVTAHKTEVALAEAYWRCYKAGMETAAVICENLPIQQDRDVRDECAAAIRARGNT
jgi:hypothetical protein